MAHRWQQQMVFLLQGMAADHVSWSAAQCNGSGTGWSELLLLSGLSSSPGSAQAGSSSAEVSVRFCIGSSCCSSLLAQSMAQVLSVLFKALLVELLPKAVWEVQGHPSMPLWNISMLLSLKAAPQPAPGCEFPPLILINPFSVLCWCSHYCFKADGSCTISLLGFYFFPRCFSLMCLSYNVCLHFSDEIGIPLSDIQQNDGIGYLLWL